MEVATMRGKEWNINQKMKIQMESLMMYVFLKNQW